MILEQLQIGAMANFTYILGDESSGEAAVVDPHGDADTILEHAERHGLAVKYILNTHTHWDHVAGNEELKERTGAAILTHPLGAVDRDGTLEEESPLRLGATEVQVLYTAGHSPDSVCLRAGDAVLTGDTLFVGECGRTDLRGGDAKAMHHSLFDVLGTLPDETKVYPGHDYGPKPFSTLGEEKRDNYTLQPRTVEEFVRFMAEP